MKAPFDSNNSICLWVYCDTLLCPICKVIPYTLFIHCLSHLSLEAPSDSNQFKWNDISTWSLDLVSYQPHGFHSPSTFTLSLSILPPIQRPLKCDCGNHLTWRPGESTARSALWDVFTETSWITWQVRHRTDHSFERDVTSCWPHKYSKACFLCSCCCREQGEPLEHQKGFHVSLVPNGSVCTTPGIWRLPLLIAHREPSNPLTSHSPTSSHAALGHQTPFLWGWGWAMAAAWVDKRGVMAPSWSLSGTNETPIRCSMIKTTMTQCWAAFRCLAFWLQTAHRCSYSKPSPRNAHTQSYIRTQIPLGTPSGSQKCGCLKCFQSRWLLKWRFRRRGKEHLWAISSP